MVPVKIATRTIEMTTAMIITETMIEDVIDAVRTIGVVTMRMTVGAITIPTTAATAIVGATGRHHAKATETTRDTVSTMTSGETVATAAARMIRTTTHQIITLLPWQSLQGQLTCSTWMRQRRRPL
jgi:hypothetical protein